MSDTGKIVALVKALAPVADQETVDSAVETYLDNHPEATTTVQDGSITEAKLAQQLATKIGQISSLSDEIDHIADSYTTELTPTITTDSWYANNGVVQAKTGYSRTDKISLDGVSAIMINFTTENYRAQFFTAEQTRIALVFSLTANQYYPIPDNAAYIGISGVSESMASLEIVFLKDGKAHDAIDSKVAIDQGVSNAGRIMCTNYGGLIQPYNLFSNAYNTFSPNLINRDACDFDVGIDGNAKSGYATTEFIPVLNGVKYCTNGMSINAAVGYDAYKNIVGNITLNTTGTVLDSAIKYVKICFAYGNVTGIKAGLFGGIDAFSNLSLNYGVQPNYYTNNPAFDKFLRTYGNFANHIPILPTDSGRYSGTDKIEQYSKLVHPTNNGLQINNSVPGDQWSARGVKQYFSASVINITRNSGVSGIYAEPADIGAEIGDTVYVGFLCRTADGLAHTPIMYVNIASQWGMENKTVYIDGTIRAYEFSHVINSNDPVSFQINADSANYEFSNIYVRKTSNLEYETLYIDPAMYNVEKYIVSENLKTKSLVAFGDSVTNAGFYLESFRKRIPVGSFVNEGIGGSCFCYTDTSASSNFYNVVDTKHADIESADIITVAYGTNDSSYIGKTTTIGQIAPIGSTFDLLTTYGAIQAGIEKIIGYNPSSRIVMIIPATWIDWAYANDIAKAITDCAELYGCIVVDFRKCGCNEITQTAMTTDTLHPTRATGELCGKILVDAMNPVYMM